MEFLLIFFGIMALFFIGRMVYKVYMIIHRFRKQYNAIFGDATAKKTESQSGRKGGWSAPPAKRKKIEKSVGEYVKFQEIRVTTQSTDSQGREYERFTVEQQVVDAEWEEIR